MVVVRRVLGTKTMQALDRSQPVLWMPRSLPDASRNENYRAHERKVQKCRYVLSERTNVDGLPPGLS